MITIKEGSRWHDGQGNNFHVLSINKIEGDTWFHYIKEKDIKHDRLPGENEYSCFVESFVSRFSPIAP